MPKLKQDNPHADEEQSGVITAPAGKRPRGRPASGVKNLKQHQEKRPNVGARISEDEWLYLKHLATNHPRIQSRSMTEFFSGMLVQFLMAKPWLNDIYDYEETSFFKKAPTPIAAKDLSKVPKSKPKNVILRTVDFTHTYSPSGKLIHQETLLNLFKYDCKLLEEEPLKVTKVYTGSPGQIAAAAMADAQKYDKEKKYWAEQIKMDTLGNEYIAKGALSEASVMYSMLRWILDTVYTDNLPSSQYPKAMQFSAHSHLDDNLIFGVPEGFNLYSLPVPADEIKEK
ncbi:hypothetical protein AAKU67_002815 [Oxalobacteraceae bacterium GrIS 2.11]